MRPDRRRRSPRDGRLYYYYRCPTRHQKGKDACSQPRSYQATETEARVWEFIADLLKDPDRLRAGLERMADQERDGLRGDPEREAKEWRRKLSEVARQARKISGDGSRGPPHLGRATDQAYGIGRRARPPNLS
jgi:hypothetical protein